MKIIRLRGTQVQFPDMCVVCMQAAHKEYSIERTFTYGRRSIVLSLPVPLCQTHYGMASSKSKAQVGLERFGLIVAIVLGLSVFMSLLRYWSTNAQGALATNILVALLAAVSLAVTLWAILYFWVAPSFASAATKSVLRSAQMTKYDPFRQELELCIENDKVADLTALANLPNLITS